MGYENCGKHPNSLKALKPIEHGEAGSERARRMQAKGAEVRRQNKELREAMKMSAAEFKKVREEILPDLPDALTILKVQLAKALAADDNEAIERLGLALAEFEAPKLSRVDQSTLTVDSSDLSEDELERRIQELSK